MDHLTPGYRSKRLQHQAEADSFLLAAARRERHHNVRTATWGFIGLLAGVGVVLCALVIPEGLILAALLGGLMFGATR